MYAYLSRLRNKEIIFKTQALSMDSFFILIFGFFIFAISNVSSAPQPTDDQFLEFVQRLPSNGKQFNLADNESEIKLKIVTYLGIMYLMKQAWDCEKLSKEFDQNEHSECEKYGGFLDKIYYYFLNVWNQGKLSTSSDQLSKPKFMMKSVYQNAEPAEFRSFLSHLCEIAKFYFSALGEAKENGYKLAQFLLRSRELSLNNAQEQTTKCQNEDNNLSEAGKHFAKMMEAMAKKAKKLANDRKWVQEEPILGYYVDGWFAKLLVNILDRFS